MGRDSTRDREPDVARLRSGVILAKRYEIESHLGRGAFSEIYEAYDKKERLSVALKVEKRRAGESESRLRKESDFHKLLTDKLSSSKHVPRYIGIYEDPKYGTFLAMEKLGKDLSKIRKIARDHKFSLCSIGYLGRQLIENLRVIHQCGLLHRDLKPHNCLLGLESRKLRLFLVDFGLAKRQMNSEGRIVPSQGKVNFRGTAAYASLRAMELNDQGWRDDLEGAFYVLADLLLGGLPWRKVLPKPENSTLRDEMIKKQKTEIIEAIKEMSKKTLVDRIPESHLCGPFDANGMPAETRGMKAKDIAQELPADLIRFFVDVHDLKYDESPNYDKLKKYFVDLEDRGTAAFLKFWGVKNKDQGITLELLGKSAVKENVKFCVQYWHYGHCLKEDCTGLHDITRAPADLQTSHNKKRKKTTS